MEGKRGQYEALAPPREAPKDRFWLAYIIFYIQVGARLNYESKIVPSREAPVSRSVGCRHRLVCSALSRLQITWEGVKPQKAPPTEATKNQSHRFPDSILWRWCWLDVVHPSFDVLRGSAN
jgi:hypothetical protein